MLELFVNLQWERVPLFGAAIVLAGAAFAAMGSAIGVAAREVRASALAAFALTLPIAFLSLVPSGTVSETLYDWIRVVTGAFPFRPALDALTAGLSDTGTDPPHLHSDSTSPPASTLAYCAIARLRASAVRVGPARGHSPAAGCGHARQDPPAERMVCLRRIASVSFPATRLRRLRRTKPLRDLVRETELSPRTWSSRCS